MKRNLIFKSCSHNMTIYTANIYFGASVSYTNTHNKYNIYFQPIACIRQAKQCLNKDHVRTKLLPLVTRK